MRRTDIVARLLAAEKRIRSHGVKGLYLFGSFAREEAGPFSDVDIFVDAEEDKFFDLGPFMAAYQDIKDALGGREIGYTTRDGLSPHIRNEVVKSAIRIF